MALAFYLSGLVAVIATLGVITGTNAVHALLNLIVSLIAVAIVFFALGAPFAGALEIIVYAGAIMVLFVFVVMILNLGQGAAEQERLWLKTSTWILPSILSLALLVILAVTLWQGDTGLQITGETLTAKAVGSTLFGPWLLVVELAAMLLLAALVTASHVGRLPRKAQSEPGGGKR